MIRYDVAWRVWGMRHAFCSPRGAFFFHDVKLASQVLSCDLHLVQPVYGLWSSCHTQAYHIGAVNPHLLWLCFEGGTIGIYIDTDSSVSLGWFNASPPVRLPKQTLQNQLDVLSSPVVYRSYYKGLQYNRPHAELPKKNKNVYRRLLIEYLKFQAPCFWGSWTSHAQLPTTLSAVERWTDVGLSCSTIVRKYSIHWLCKEHASCLVVGAEADPTYVLPFECYKWRSTRRHQLYCTLYIYIFTATLRLRMVNADKRSSIYLTIGNNMFHFWRWSLLWLFPVPDDALLLLSPWLLHQPSDKQPSKFEEGRGLRDTRKGTAVQRRCYHSVVVVFFVVLVVRGEALFLHIHVSPGIFLRSTYCFSQKLTPDSWKIVVDILARPGGSSTWIPARVYSNMFRGRRGPCDPPPCQWPNVVDSSNSMLVMLESCRI